VQGFGANIFNSAYFSIKRKGLAQTFSESAKIFSLHQKFLQACQNFLQFVSLPKEKMQEVKCDVRTKMKGVKQKSQSKAKQKVMCVPLKLSENSFCKKNVKS
jgi:hypothetical protein